LRDRWGQVGYGKVLTFFGPDGRVLASYTLEQLLPFDEILEVPITASSRWWGSNALFFFRQGQKQFAFVTERGTIGVFELATGRRLPLSSALKMAVRQEALQITRKEVRHPNPFCRTRAALLLGTLGDRSDIPALKALLHDPTSSCRVIMSYWRQPQKRFEVQLAAGKALARLLGAEAVPLLDAKLPGANRYMLLWSGSGSLALFSAVSLECAEEDKDELGAGQPHRLKSLQSVGFGLVTVRVRVGNGVRRGLVGRISGVGLPAKDQGSAKRHVAATTNHAEFGQPEAVFEGVGKARQRHQIVELPLVQRGMGFALRAPTKVASWWGQGFAIIVVLVVAIIGVIGSPKGFGRVGNRRGVIGKRVGVRRGLVGRVSGVLVGVLTVPVPQKAVPP
jgi:hypothetical protein